VTTHEALEIAKVLDGFESIGYLYGEGAEFRYWFRESAKTIRDLVTVINKIMEPLKDEE